MRKKVFITGNSQGLGYGLTQAYLERNDTVYGCSRKGCHGLESHELHDYQCDLSKLNDIHQHLDYFLGDLERLDLVILNAGILGEIKDLHETSLDEIYRVFNINVWANKVILDWLHAQAFPVHNIVLMSSGAAVNGNGGWNGYALSKAALNMLTAQYAHEFPDSHLIAFAPGIIHTQMQDYLCNHTDTKKFPSIDTLKQAYGTEHMPSPRTAGQRIAERFERLREFPSGSFIDIRKI